MWVLIPAAVLAAVGAGGFVYAIVARSGVPNRLAAPAELTGEASPVNGSPREGRAEPQRLTVDPVPTIDPDATLARREGVAVARSEQAAESRFENEVSSAALTRDNDAGLTLRRGAQAGGRTQQVVSAQPSESTNGREAFGVEENVRRAGFAVSNAPSVQREAATVPEPGVQIVDPLGLRPAGEEADPSPALPEPLAPELPMTERLVVDFIIGGSHPDQRRRQVGWNLIEKGWKHFVDKNVAAYLEGGAQRIILHNPFGSLKGEAMQLDQYPNALAQLGLRRLTHDFVDAWSPVTGRGIEVIAYIGCPRLDPDATRIDEEQGREAALAFSMDCVEPFLESGMSVALDASAPATAGSLTWDMAVALREIGVKVYVEARPHAVTPHWFDFPVICINHYWRRSDPDRHPDTKGASNAVLTGEILRMVVQYTVPEGWGGSEADYILSQAREIQAASHTPVVLAGSKLPPAKAEQLLQPASTEAFD